MFFHSSSYTANPIACAAAVANLAMWREEPVLRADRHAGGAAGGAARRADGRPQRPRGFGTIAACEIGGGERLSRRDRPGARRAFPRPRPARPPDGRHRLRHAALLHRRGRPRSRSTPRSRKRPSASAASPQGIRPCAEARAIPASGLARSRLSAGRDDMIAGRRLAGEPDHADRSRHPAADPEQSRSTTADRPG